METFIMNTDRNLKSQMEYGNEYFPFTYYYDEIKKYQNHLINWHWHEQLEFSFCISGPVTCRIGTETIQLKTHDAVFVNSEIIHSFESDNGILGNFLFQPDFIASPGSKIYSQFFQPVLSSGLDYMVIEEKTPAAAESAQRLANLNRSINNLNALEIHIKVAALWNSFTKALPENLLQREPQNKLQTARLHIMLEYIRNNYSKKITLRDIAGSACISSSEALRCFRLGVKSTPISSLNAFRLEKACKLLLSTSDSVTAIALNTGFDNSNYFCKVFKKAFGCTPQAFRKL